MKLNLINSKTTNNGKLLELDLQLTNKEYQFNYSSQYSNVADIFKEGLSKIGMMNKVSKVMSSMDKIRRSLYGIFDNLGKINYGDCGLLTSKYYNSSSMSQLTFDFVIENESINFKGDKRKEKEKEFERKWSTLLYFSLFKKKGETIQDINSVLKDYYDENTNKLLQGIQISDFTFKYLQAELGKTGLIGDTESQLNFIKNLSFNRETGTTDGVIATWLNDMETKFGQLINNEFSDLKFYTPESVFIQLYEEIDDSKYYFINSLTPKLFKEFQNKKETSGIETEEFMERLKQKGAFIFNIKNVTLYFEDSNFIQHSNNNFYPPVIKGQIILENSRGITLNESERFFTNYFNILKQYN